jgi:hypothetical protein
VARSTSGVVNAQNKVAAAPTKRSYLHWFARLGLSLAATNLAACASQAGISVPSSMAPASPASAARTNRTVIREGVTADISIGATAITTMTGETIMPLPEDRVAGAAAVFKRSGASDFYLVPLGLALSALPTLGDLKVDVDPSTPYRMLVEVLFTAGQHKIARYELRQLRTSGLPLQTRGLPMGEPVNLTLLIAADGISIITRDGKLAPGCDGVGPGPTVPRVSGQYDHGSLASCLKKIKARQPNDRSVVAVASSNITFGEMRPLLDIARGDHLELFPEISFGIMN